MNERLIGRRGGTPWGYGIVAMIALLVTWPAIGQPTPGGFSVEVDGRTIRGRQELPSPLKDGESTERIEDGGVRVERRTVVKGDSLRVYTRVVNGTDHPVSLGTAKVLEGRWAGGAGTEGSPAAICGDATLTCQPHGAATARTYSTTNVLELVTPGKDRALVAGFLSARAARPEVAAKYRPGQPVEVSASQRFLGHRLLPGASVEMDPVYLATSGDPFGAMDAYAGAVAEETHPRAPEPAVALWCSWYAHRMAVSEDLVLANAAVAAKDFQPLGLRIMQLDHGWQEGDVTGDWQVDRAAFPHGLKWLAAQLQSRYGMKLGLWIAPTDVAETSELFQHHPDWMLKDAAGKPLVNWRWYWKPNPNCYELDATNPSAAKYIADTFARLTADGAAYYKIDFIAASAGEQFVQSDPTATRGWSNLVRAMQTIRAGAGGDAWIRYCQTPLLTSAGLADGTVGGDDTLDAGRPGGFHVLRDNARALAAGYWINDRLYRREVCDMSVQMRADVEEVRVRLAMMALAGCSISFSDELQNLPPSRIAMMQQCLPPGTGSARMRPVDLYDREVPSVWWLHCKNAADAWDVVGLFNFDDAPQQRTVDFAELGLPADQEQAVFGFWEERFLGTHRGRITLTLEPHTSRVLSIRRATAQPQVVGTDMHLLQGMHELSDVRWDAATQTLSGRAERAPHLRGKIFIRVPDQWFPRFEFPLGAASAHLTHVAGPLWAKEIEFGDTARVDWTIPFEPIEVARRRVY